MRREQWQSGVVENPNQLQTQRDGVAAKSTTRRNARAVGKERVVRPGPPRTNDRSRPIPTRGRQSVGYKSIGL